MSERKFTFEKGKLYVASIVLRGLQRLASAETVASKVSQALGMQVNARKVKPGEFVVSGIWNGANKEVSLPSEVANIRESG